MNSGFSVQIAMMKNILFPGLLILLPGCGLQTQDNTAVRFPENRNIEYQSISGIPVPGGYSRLAAELGSFAEWLRRVKLKKDNRVFLYNGSLKGDQSAQFAVLDMPIGKKDLQQCADAVMRLRAEYFFSQQNFDSIHFKATDGTVMSFAKWRNGARYKLSGNYLKTVFSTGNSVNGQSDFENYLETVFSYAGTCSLAAELKPAGNINDIQPGDVFIKPGFPGHAMIIVDVCVNKFGQKLFMLAQGYMPAQDIHIVKNYENGEISPWYEIPVSDKIFTPEWTFNTNQLKKWQ
jgi:Domain of unknown function (4846)